MSILHLLILRRVLKHTHIFCKNKHFNLKQKENDVKQLQNVLFYATYRSHQRQTRPTDDSSHAYPLLRSLHRTSFPNDYLQ